MNAIANAIAAWGRDVWRAWDRFWFTPAQPHTLALIRILGGGMILYTHLVWTLNLEAFLGPKGWLPRSTVALMNQGADGRIYAWSYLAWTDSPPVLWTLHIAGLIVLAMLVLGLYTRVASILAFIITLSYCHRLTGSLFGLDQVNAMIATYLMLGNSGAVYSIDRWLARRRGAGDTIEPTVGTNVALRLIQLQMCIIYLFGGIGKMRGELWWDGSALWFGFANLEYQSLDMTWMVKYDWLIALLTHITVFWETFYCFFVWPRLTRPICLGLAVLVHGGIALTLGMVTFGTAMIVGNMAFLPPELVRDAVALLGRPLRRLAQGREAPAASTAVFLAARQPTSAEAR